MIKLIGKKLGMTSLFDEEGNNIACTVIQAGPCVVTQVKTKETDGYEAVQIGWGTKKEKKINAAEKGHFKKSKAQSSTVIEIRDADGDLKVGDTYGIEILEEGQIVDIVGTSKGKGFQGVVKRHGFAGVGQATHGQHNRLRAPGSIGAASYPARVFKGMRMAGQMGNKRVKMIDLKVVKLDADKGLVIVKGAVPGHKNSIVVIER